MEKFLQYLVKLQKRTAPIKLTIGHKDSNNLIKHNYIVIKEAPAVVLNEIILNSAGETYDYSLNSDGLVIHFYQEGERI